MSKIAIIATDYVEDIELSSPRDALNKEGHETFIVGTEKGVKIKGKKGETFVADYGIDEVSEKDFDAILIPGGFSPDILRVREEFVKFVRDFLLYNKPTFAICHGAQIFIQTGLTKGRKMTAYLSIQQDLYYAGAIVEDKSVVIDNNLITSRTPADLEDFNREIVNILK